MWSAAELTYKCFEDFCEHVKAASNGRLVIQPFAAGAVTGVFETLDAVTAGVLQAHSSWPGYWTGKDAGLAVISDFVFGYQHPWQAEAWFYHRGGLQMLREAYAKYNAYPVGVSWWGVESIVSKKPINKMEDFKGVKFRSPQGMTAEILTKLGASIVVLPGGEVYSALDKGVVDAADWATISMNQRMGFHEVAKFPTKLFHSMPVQEFTRQHGRLEEAARRHQGDRARQPCANGPGTRSSASPSTTSACRRSWPAKGVIAAILGRRRDGQDPRAGGEDLGGMVEEDAARQAGLRLADGLAQGSQGRRV